MKPATKVLINPSDTIGLRTMPILSPPPHVEWRQYISLAKALNRYYYYPSSFVGKRGLDSIAKSGLQRGETP